MYNSQIIMIYMYGKINLYLLTRIYNVDHLKKPQTRVSIKLTWFIHVYRILIQKGGNRYSLCNLVRRGISLFFVKGIIKKGTTILMIAVFALAFYAFVIEPEILKVRKFKISDDKGLKVLFFSDLHMRHYTNFHAQLINQIKELKPNYILFGGDAVKSGVNFSDLQRFFTELSKIAPCYAVFGNWDYDIGSKLKEVYKNSGVILLDGKEAVLSGKNGSLTLVGMPLNRRYTFTGNKHPLVFGHYPHTIFRYTGIEPVLYLSGHTHGGQVYIPYISNLLLKNKYPILKGMGNFGKHRVLVSAGVGSWLHFRLFVPPEIVLIQF